MGARARRAAARQWYALPRDSLCYIARQLTAESTILSYLGSSCGIVNSSLVSLHRDRLTRMVRTPFRPAAQRGPRPAAPTCTARSSRADVICIAGSGGGEAGGGAGGRRTRDEGDDGDGAPVPTWTLFILAAAAATATLPWARRGLRFWLGVSPILASYVLLLLNSRLRDPGPEAVALRLQSHHELMAPRALQLVQRLAGGYIKMGQVCLRPGGLAKAATA